MVIYEGAIAKLYHPVRYGKLEAISPPLLVFIWALGTTEV